jgi:hypothetical protein
LSAAAPAWAIAIEATWVPSIRSKKTSSPSGSTIATASFQFQCAGPDGKRYGKGGGEQRALHGRILLVGGVSLCPIAGTIHPPGRAVQRSAG